MNEREAGRHGEHPIGVVSKRTGISLHVLRAWERRYEVVQPTRTAGGQRLYSDADIRRLRLLRQVTDSGRNISQVAELTDAELEALVSEDVQEVAAPASQIDTAEYVRACLAAGERLDGDEAHAVLMRAMMRLRIMEFLGGVVQPLLHAVGERWHAGRMGAAQEHVVSVAVRRVLTWLLEAYESPAGAPVVVVTTAAGEQHEFGAMLVGAIALEEGWRVSYLGPSLPADEIVRAAVALDAAMVAVSLVASAAGDGAAAEFERMAAGVGPATVVVAGGAGAVARQAELEGAGVRVAGTLDAAREVLRVQRELMGGGA